MNLFYEKYPTSIDVDGRKIPIITDFREYVKLADMLRSDELNLLQKRYFLQGYFKERPDNFEKAVNALSGFVTMDLLNQSRPEESDIEEEKQKDVYSYEMDYPFIFSAFLHDYGINIRTVPYMHWWEFRMLFWGLSEETEIKQRIRYRSIDLSKIKDKDERKRIERIQRSIQLPESVLDDYDIGNAFI